MNNISIMGRLTRDPELTTSQSGVEMCKYTVAVDRQKDKNGNKKTDFFGCIAFGQGGAFVNKYFRKGDGIIVHGRMESSKSEKDGKVYWNLVAEKHDFPLSRSLSETRTGAAAPETPPADQSAGFTAVETDELPF